MPLGVFIAGPYTASYAAATAGMTQRGFEVRLRAEQEVIGETDIYGDTIIDSITRGGNVLLAFNAVEFGKAVDYGMLWPQGAVNTTSVPGLGFLGTVGRSVVGSSLFKAVVLTALTGTTASATPATMTATQASQADNSETAYMLGPTLRQTPVVLRLFPYTVTNPTGFAAGTYVVWFQHT